MPAAFTRQRLQRQQPDTNRTRISFGRLSPLIWRTIFHGSALIPKPYKGGGPSVAATVAGETQFSFENPASSLPLVEAGRVRALASTSDRRSSQMPDVPTMIEAGIADFTSVSFTGVVAPAGTPGAIVDRLNAAINASLQSPEIASTLVKLGVDAKISSPEEFAAFLAAERDKWAAVIKAAGVQAE